MNINKGQEKTSILLFFSYFTFQNIWQRKTQKVSDIAPVSPTPTIEKNWIIP